MDNHNGDAGRREPPNQLVRAFQASIANEELLFQLVDFFPFPIEIFAPDGMTVFVNQAACDTWNVDGPGEIIGRYNIRQDPVVNDALGMRREVEQAFAGETVALSDRIVALEDIGSRYRTRNPHSEVESVYNDIFCFPIWDQDRSMAYVVMVFITTRLYQGQSDIARAKEYIDNNWRDVFDLDTLAKAVNFSPYHFARLFKKHTGETPLTYYKKTKVKKLKEALLNPNTTVTEAFASCGVAYNGSAARMFREVTGQTPSAYRKSALAKR